MFKGYTSIVLTILVGSASILTAGAAFGGSSTGRTTFGSSYSAPREYAPVYIQAPVPSYPSYYADPNGSRLRVRLPENARLWIEDEPTLQNGRDRLFESPPLTPGKDYAFHLKAEWTENGKQIVRTRTVPIHAGDFVNIDMTQGK
jgi:uncharacterized protein (TIGR03000 family)